MYLEQWNGVFDYFGQLHFLLLEVRHFLMQWIIQQPYYLSVIINDIFDMMISSVIINDMTFDPQKSILCIQQSVLVIPMY